MAERDGDRVARVVVETAFWQLHLRRQHAPDLRLVRVAVAGEDDLDLTRLVLVNRDATLLEHVQDRTTRLGHTHSARRVAAHEQLFYRRLRRRVLGDEGAKVIRD